MLGAFSLAGELDLAVLADLGEGVPLVLAKAALSLQAHQIQQATLHDVSQTVNRLHEMIFLKKYTIEKTQNRFLKNINLLKKNN